MIRDNMVSEALSLLGIHALDYEKRAKELGDEETAFVWAEIRSMMRSLADLRRSPLHDALNDRLGQKTNDGAYYVARIVAVTAALMLMKNSSLSKAQACREIGNSTGIKCHILEKKMGLPANVADIDSMVRWEHLEEVMNVLQTVRDIVRIRENREAEPEELVSELIELAKGNFHTDEQLEKHLP